MLKALFESSIDKLNIPADMKSAIKQINNICLEAEGQEKDPAKNYNYEAYPQGKSIMKEDSDERVAAQKKEAEAKKNGQEKDTSVKGVDPDVEKTAKNGWNYDVTEDMKKNDKEDEKPAKEEEKETKEEPKEEEAKADESKEEAKEEPKAEEQPAQSAEPEENKGTQIAKGATREPSQVRTSGPTSSEPNTATQTAEAQPAQQQAAPKAAPRPRADVATVQYFLQSLLPNTNLVADGILGPKTISAIQQKEDQEVTGKMDSKTKQSFDLLLAEAKKKVIPMQQQLGVTADGLIGKQTLQAMNKANMKVANVFSKNATAPQQAPQQVASNKPKANVNVLDTPFDAAKAQKDLQNNQITKLEYNMWKEYGVSPQHQRSNPAESKQEITRLAKIPPSERGKQQEANANANTNKSLVPQNDVEKKFYNQTVKNYIGVYTQLGEDEKTAKNHAIRAAQNALIKFRAGKWANGNQQNAQPQQAAQANAQPQQAAQANAQPAQQQAQKQPAQQGNQQQAAAPQKNNQNNEVYHTMKDSKGTTEYYSGNISWNNLSPEEKKIKEDAEAKEQAKYYDGKQVKKNPKTGKPYDEQIVLHRIQSAGQNAVIKNRMAKARERQAASGKQG
jgi:hypothetical protein